MDEKPSYEKRQVPKREGWRWAPSEGAWQRKITEDAKQSAKRLMGQG